MPTFCLSPLQPTLPVLKVLHFQPRWRFGQALQYVSNYHTRRDFSAGGRAQDSLEDKSQMTTDPSPCKEDSTKGHVSSLLNSVKLGFALFDGIAPRNPPAKNPELSGGEKTLLPRHEKAPSEHEELAIKFPLPDHLTSSVTNAKLRPIRDDTPKASTCSPFKENKTLSSKENRKVLGFNLEGIKENEHEFRTRKYGSIPNADLFPANQVRYKTTLARNLALSDGHEDACANLGLFVGQKYPQGRRYFTDQKVLRKSSPVQEVPPTPLIRKHVVKQPSFFFKFPVSAKSNYDECQYIEGQTPSKEHTPSQEVSEKHRSSITQIQKISDKRDSSKMGSGNQDLARKRESQSARNQELPNLSWSSKAKSHEMSKEMEMPDNLHRKLSLHNDGQMRTNPNLSLLEELFPEEIGKAADLDITDEGEESVPRLPLPDFDDEAELYNHAQDWSLHEGDWAAKVASKNALHQWNLAVLVVRRASKSLNESDFRRIAPKGQHIDEWRGPGDFLKVIPARDPSTLRQADHYFLLFPNPAYARAYQSHVVSLHRIARTHTPTSIESPMSPPPGMLVEGEDIYSVLQNYALCPPSQKIALKFVFPPYSPALKRLLELRGYPQIMRPEDKSHKSVLLWVDGFQPTIHDIRDMIARDKRSRGLNWALASSMNPVEKVDSSAYREWGEGDSAASESAEETQFRGLYPRYLIHFADENEARRFTREWHRRPFPLPKARIHSHEPPPLVHTEFVW